MPYSGAEGSAGSAPGFQDFPEEEEETVDGLAVAVFFVLRMRVQTVDSGGSRYQAAKAARPRPVRRQNSSVFW